MNDSALAPHIFQLSISAGGVPKLAVANAVVTPAGLEGDWQRNRRYHGGPRRAVCLFSLESILRLQADGHPIFPGSTGENITLAGVDLAALVPGTVVALGDEVVLEITDYAVPCRTIAGSFADGKSARMSHKRSLAMSRLYARVLEGGTLRPGMSVRVVPTPSARSDVHPG